MYIMFICIHAILKPVMVMKMSASDQPKVYKKCLSHFHIHTLRRKLR